MSLQACVLAGRYGVSVSVWWSRAHMRLGRLYLRRAVGSSDLADSVRWSRRAQAAFDAVRPGGQSSACDFKGARPQSA